MWYIIRIYGVCMYVYIYIWCIICIYGSRKKSVYCIADGFRSWGGITSSYVFLSLVTYVWKLNFSTVYRQFQVFRMSLVGDWGKGCRSCIKWLMSG